MYIKNQKISTMQITPELESLESICKNCEKGIHRNNKLCPYKSLGNCRCKEYESIKNALTKQILRS